MPRWTRQAPPPRPSWPPRPRAAGALLLGPNCLGAINVHRRLAATFTTALEALDPVPGGFSYMGQSGALGAYWLEMASRAGLGIASWITTGNEAQVTGADALAYLARDAVTKVIGAYIEDIKDPDAFAEAAETARAAGKTLLVLKSGRSAAGAHAALAHTASKAGEADWYDGFLRECGAAAVHSLSEMIDVARVLSAAAPSPPDPRLAIVTVSGGAGVLACDAAEALGVRLASFPDSLRAELRTILPGFAQAPEPRGRHGRSRVGQAAHAAHARRTGLRRRVRRDLGVHRLHGKHSRQPDRGDRCDPAPRQAAGGDLDGRARDGRRPHPSHGRPRIRRHQTGRRRPGLRLEPLEDTLRRTP